MIIGMMLMAGAGWFLLSRVQATQDFAHGQSRVFSDAVRLAITEHQNSVKEHEAHMQATVATRVAKKVEAPKEPEPQVSTDNDDIRI